MYRLLIGDFVVIDCVNYCYYYCYNSLHYYDVNYDDIEVKREHDCSAASAAANSL